LISPDPLTCIPGCSVWWNDSMCVWSFPSPCLDSCAVMLYALPGLAS
jgi:hypothetical protein